MLHLFGEKPHWIDLMQKLRGGWRQLRNHVCQVLNWNFNLTILQGVKISFNH